MPDKLTVVAITLPEFIAGEWSRISSLLQEGRADFVHIRKPGASEEQVEELIKAIHPALRCRLKLHEHFPLALKYGLGGIHLNSRWPDALPGVASISKSCHSLKELGDAARYNYVTLSPIFDSISKPGYLSRFALEDLAEHLAGKRVVALGGVTPSRFPALQEAGFWGAAMLGYFWK